jgi:hypothetical protein
MSKQAKTPPELALRGAALPDRVNATQDRRKLIIGYSAHAGFHRFLGSYRSKNLSEYGIDPLTEDANGNITERHKRVLLNAILSDNYLVTSRSRSCDSIPQKRLRSTVIC